MSEQPKRKRGRPPAIIDDERTMKQLEGLGAIMATTKEMAAVLRVDETTFIRFLNEHPPAREAIKKGNGDILTSLRRKQVTVALRGSVAMLIWLGKQHLEQFDRREYVPITPDVKPPEPVRMVAVYPKHEPAGASEDA